MRKSDTYYITHSGKWSGFKAGKLLVVCAYVIWCCPRHTPTPPSPPAQEGDTPTFTPTNTLTFHCFSYFHNHFYDLPRNLIISDYMLMEREELCIGINCNQAHILKMCSLTPCCCFQADAKLRLHSEWNVV